MIIAHTADLHLTERKGDSNESLDEQEARLLWIGEDAHKHDAKLMLVAGDIFDGLSSPNERNTAIRVFTEWAAKMPVVIVRGNHDRLGDPFFLSCLKSELPLRYVETFEVIEISNATIACIGWPQKAWLVSQMEAISNSEVTAVAVQAIRNLLLAYGARLADKNIPRILLAHAELGTALADSGQPMVGKCDIELCEGDLVDSRVDYIALGHIHKHQILGNGLICYAGSPRQTNFGEDPIKGYCLVEIERAQKPVIEHRLAPGRQLVTVTGVWKDQSLLFDIEPEAIPQDSIVRVQYEEPEDLRESVAAMADAYIDTLDGRLVKRVPRMVPNYRTRSEEIQHARTNKERIEAWWKTRGQRPERANSIFKKLIKLESEVAL